MLFQPRDPRHPFVWAVGIEDTFVPQTRPGHRSLDEYALMGHDLLWREDLDRIAGLGVGAVRYGVPWHRVNPSPGRLDWSWLDPVLHHMVESRGLTPIVDLVHYGTPLWLKDEFLAADYPERVADYARSFAERYRGLVRHYTPTNEPSVTAIRSGRDGAWPPYRRGVRGHLAVLLAVTRGMIATAEAIRRVQPEAVFVHAEDIGIESASTEEAASWAALKQAWRWLPLDLACGRVGVDHPLFDVIVAAGADAEELVELARRGVRWDVLGVNFYPWSNRRWKRQFDGSCTFGRDRSDPADALASVLRRVHDRYQIPVMVTETSASGSLPRRLAWMGRVASGVNKARTEGVPVVGLTWFPVFTMVDWRYRRSKRPIEHHLLHLGLWDVPYQRGSLRRVATPLVEAYQKLVAGPVAEIGPPDRKR